MKKINIISTIVIFIGIIVVSFIDPNSNETYLDFPAIMVRGLVSFIIFVASIFYVGTLYILLMREENDDEKDFINFIP